MVIFLVLWVTFIAGLIVYLRTKKFQKALNHKDTIIQHQQLRLEKEKLQSEERRNEQIAQRFLHELELGWVSLQLNEGVIGKSGVLGELIEEIIQTIPPETEPQVRALYHQCTETLLSQVKMANSLSVHLRPEGLGKVSLVSLLSEYFVEAPQSNEAPRVVIASNEPQRIFGNRFDLLLFRLASFLIIDGLARQRSSMITLFLETHPHSVLLHYSDDDPECHASQLAHRPVADLEIPFQLIRTLVAVSESVITFDERPPKGLKLTIEVQLNQDAIVA